MMSARKRLVSEPHVDRQDARNHYPILKNKLRCPFLASPLSIERNRDSKHTRIRPQDLTKKLTKLQRYKRQ